MKAQFGMFAVCVIDEKYPRSWTEEFRYTPREYGGVDYEQLSKFTLKVVDLHISNYYYETQFAWKKTKPKMVPFITSCIAVKNPRCSAVRLSTRPNSKQL